LLLIFVLLTGFSFAQELSSPDKSENKIVDETSLILFPDETQGLAADGNNQQSDPAPASVGMADLVRVVFVLIAVIIVIYMLIYFLKRFTPLAENEEDQISLLATRHLKKDSSLHIVEVGNQIFLIGSGTNSVSLISEITDKETLDKLHLETTVTKLTERGGSFRNMIKKNFSPGASNKGIGEQSPDFLRQQRERLRHLRENK